MLLSQYHLVGIASAFLQDDASAGIQSLQTSIEVKLCQNPWNGLQCIFISLMNTNIFCNKLSLSTEIFLIFVPFSIFMRTIAYCIPIVIEKKVENKLQKRSFS